MKTLKLAKILSDDEIEKAKTEISEMKSSPGTLLSLVQVLSDAIQTARENGAEWDKITKYMSELSGTEIKTNDVSDAYFSVIKKNGEGEISYSQLKTRYRIAVQLLKKDGHSEDEIDDVASRESERRRQKYERSKTKKLVNIEKNIQQTDDIKDNTEQTTIETKQQSTVQFSGQTKIREDKNLYRQG